MKLGNSSTSVDLQRTKTGSMKQLMLRQGLLVLTCRGGQGAGGAQPAWARPQGCFRLQAPASSGLPATLRYSHRCGRTQFPVCFLDDLVHPAGLLPASSKMSKQGTQGASYCPWSCSYIHFPSKLTSYCPVIKLSAPNKGCWLRKVAQAVWAEGRAVSWCQGWEARDKTLPPHTDSRLSHH